MYKKKVPRISLEIAYQDKETGRITTVKDSITTPLSKFPANKFTKLYEKATVNAKDVLAIHKSKCPNSSSNPQNRIQISCDGVAECRSNSVSLDVYSFKAFNCRHIYPLQIIRPLNKVKIDHSLNLQNVLDDLVANSCKIDQFVGDNLKRATAKGCLNHASTFACEYCFSSAVRYIPPKSNDSTNTLQKKIIKEKIDSLRKDISSLSVRQEIKKLEQIYADMEKKNHVGS